MGELARNILLDHKLIDCAVPLIVRRPVRGADGGLVVQGVQVSGSCQTEPVCKEEERQGEVNVLDLNVFFVCLYAILMLYPCNIARCIVYGRAT